MLPRLTSTADVAADAARRAGGGRVRREGRGGRPVALGLEGRGGLGLLDRWRGLAERGWGRLVGSWGRGLAGGGVHHLALCHGGQQQQQACMCSKRRRSRGRGGGVTLAGHRWRAGTLPAHAGRCRRWQCAPGSLPGGNSTCEPFLPLEVGKISPNHTHPAPAARPAGSWSAWCRTTTTYIAFARSGWTLLRTFSQLTSA